MDSLSRIWETRHYNLKAGEGIVSGYCIAIAKASAKLWTSPNMFINSNYNNTIRKKVDTDESGPVDFISGDEIYYNPDVTNVSPFFSDQVISLDFAQIIAADIAGALGGATGSILQDVFNHQSINWSNAGAWAIGGAVSGSTVGGVYKVVKWFASLL